MGTAKAIEQLKIEHSPIISLNIPKIGKRDFKKQNLYTRVCNDFGWQDFYDLRSTKLFFLCLQQ